LEFGVTKFELDVARMAVRIYKAFCAKNQEEIESTVRELVSLWSSFNVAICEETQ